MARYRHDEQESVSLSLAALQDGRLRRGSALPVYGLGVTYEGIGVQQIAAKLGLTERTVNATLAHLRQAGWALDLGGDHLFLDRPVEVGRDGAIRETEYSLACLRYALGLTGSSRFVSVLSPEDRRRQFRIVTSAD